jgi:hypothetical protein
MKIPPEVKFQPVGKCIYCGTDRVRLNPEHIIPFSFGGHYVLPEASCQACADMTGADEGHCCSDILRALRVHQQFPTRRPKKRPKTLPILEGKEPEGAPLRDVPISDAPGILLLPILQPPRILFGLPPSDQLGHVTFAYWLTTEDAVQRQRKLISEGLAGALTYSRFQFAPFLRTLAKIAHGYDVANVGIANSDGTRNPYILRKDDKIPYLVGGTPPNGPLATIVPIPRDDSGLHQLYPFAAVIDGLSYVAVQIRLFAHLRPPTPVYTVIMRRHPLAEGDAYLTIVTKK